MKELLAGATVAERRLAPEEAVRLLDIDTREDLVRARRQRDRRTLDGTRQVSERGDRDMDEWIDALRLEFDLDVPVDVDTILDVARFAAHNVARPAAPVTTFLLGIAVARGADLAEASRKVEGLAEGWIQPE